jgi:hypothetical protein
VASRGFFSAECDGGNGIEEGKTSFGWRRDLPSHHNSAGHIPVHISLLLDVEEAEKYPAIITKNAHALIPGPWEYVT